MHEYQKPYSQQTLSVGIEEYFAAHADYLSSRELSPEAVEFFRCHDTAHVVFGCGIALADEAVVKISSFFGTTGGKKVWHGYRLAESKEIYGEITLAEIAITAFKSLVVVPRTIFHCSQMKARWPWEEFDIYLDQPLVEIRAQFGIKVRAP